MAQIFALYGPSVKVNYSIVYHVIKNAYGLIYYQYVHLNLHNV